VVTVTVKDLSGVDVEAVVVVVDNFSVDAVMVEADEYQEEEPYSDDGKVDLLEHPILGLVDVSSLGLFSIMFLVAALSHSFRVIISFYTWGLISLSM
jgi:hypothetical protein